MRSAGRRQLRHGWISRGPANAQPQWPPPPLAENVAPLNRGRIHTTPPTLCRCRSNIGRAQAKSRRPSTNGQRSATMAPPSSRKDGAHWNAQNARTWGRALSMGPRNLANSPGTERRKPRNSETSSMLVTSRARLRVRLGGLLLHASSRRGPSRRRARPARSSGREMAPLRLGSSRCVGSRAGSRPEASQAALEDPPRARARARRRIAFVASAPEATSRASESEPPNAPASG